MSQHEGKFRADGTGAIELPELLRMIADAALPERQRQAAVGCYLSAGLGWRDAGQQLRGAFAVAARPGRRAGKAGLTGRKEA